MLRPTLRPYLCAFAALLVIQSTAGAVILDWDTIYWEEGTLSNFYQADLADPDSGVTVTVTPNNGAPIVPYAGGTPMTPAVNAVFQGGGPTIQNTLTLAVDLANPSQSISVTVFFAASGGATDVSFRLFDIDAGGPYQDHLTLIRALSIDGSTLIAPTITTSVNNTLVGSGIDQSVVGTATTADTGLTSGRANVTIDFGSNLIQSLTFTYGGTAAFANPAYQHFGIDDINFTPVPEVNPAVMSMLSCLAAAGVILRHRANVRRK
jgi:hypothetical protein